MINISLEKFSGGLVENAGQSRSQEWDVLVGENS